MYVNCRLSTGFPLLSLWLIPTLLLDSGKADFTHAHEISRPCGQGRLCVLDHKLKSVIIREIRGCFLKLGVYYVFLLHLRQIAPQNIVHGERLDRAFHHTRHRVIHEIGGNAQRLREQLIDAPQ